MSKWSQVTLLIGLAVGCLRWFCGNSFRFLLASARTRGIMDINERQLAALILRAW